MKLGEKMTSELMLSSNAIYDKYYEDTNKAIYDKYFKDKSAHDDLEKAYYAYHAKVNDSKQAHSYVHTHKSLNVWGASDYVVEKFNTELCDFCKKTRNQIRWMDESPHCQSRPERLNKYVGKDIEQIIFMEEESYFNLLEKAKNGGIEKILNKKFNGKLSAKALLYMKTTLGYEPDIVSTILDVDIEHLMDELDTLTKKAQTKKAKK